MNQKFGLIGKSLSHSFSKNYFTKKFEDLNISASYENLPIQIINEFPRLLESGIYTGFNVTIPYKEKILPFLDEIDEEAKIVGAVNTICVSKNGKTKGYNTDVYGFKMSIKPFLEGKHQHALILGTGGAAKAVEFVLSSIGIDCTKVSRNPSEIDFSYEALNERMLRHFLLIVNTTPLGMFPNIDDCPPIPYQHVCEDHFFIDLIYNPEESLFLKKARNQGAMTLNGLSMLHLQAEKSWELWNLNK